MEQEILPRYVGESEILRFIREVSPLKVEEDSLCQTVLSLCERDQVPILSPETCSLLAFLLKMRKPLRVLEIGTAYGFSSLFMCQHLPAGAHIDSIERNPVMLERLGNS